MADLTTVKKRIPRSVYDEVIVLDPAGVPYKAEIAQVEIYDDDLMTHTFINAPQPGVAYPVDEICYLLISKDGHTAMDEYAGEQHILEGWARPKPGKRARVLHYFEGGKSLCGRWYYDGEEIRAVPTEGQLLKPGLCTVCSKEHMRRGN